MKTSPLTQSALGDARRQVETCCREFTDPDVATLRDAVEGVQRLTGVLGELVDRIRDHAPFAFDDENQHIGEELVRDLHATRGCLTTAGLLVAPALDDLRELTGSTAELTGRTPELTGTTPRAATR